MLGWRVRHAEGRRQGSGGQGQGPRTWKVGEPGMLELKTSMGGADNVHSGPVPGINEFASTCFGELLADIKTGEREA